MSNILIENIADTSTGIPVVVVILSLSLLIMSFFNTLAIVHFNVKSRITLNC